MPPGAGSQSVAAGAVGDQGPRTGAASSARRSSVAVRGPAHDRCGVVRTVVAAFERSHPRVDISYSVIFSPEQAKTEVVDERAEFALVGLVEPGWPLTARPLLDEPLVVVHAPGHPLSNRDPVSLGNLGEHTLLLRESPVLGHDEIVRQLGEGGVTPALEEFGSTEAIEAEATATSYGPVKDLAVVGVGPACDGGTVRPPPWRPAPLRPSGSRA